MIPVLYNWGLHGNTFAYCGNEPINNIDPDGYVKINIKWLGFAVDFIIWLIPTLFAISKIWSSVLQSADKLLALGQELIKYGKKLLKRLDDRLYCAFARDTTYRIVKTLGVLAGIANIFFSIGDLVEYIVDILDGRWDGYLDTDNFGPKLTLNKEY